QINDWLPFRDDFLDELLRYEGCEQPIESGEVLCELCNTVEAMARCQDCRRRPLVCKECLLHSHTDLPLHRPEIWDESRFVRTTLYDLGLSVQLGHSRGTCKHPSPATRRITIVDTCGIQPVRVRFCECLDEQNDIVREWIQLFREGWFPASTTRPETAVTFQLLKTFQEINLAAKTNLYDFTQALNNLTDNAGSQDVPQLSHVIRLWRHLVALKRFGRAHDPLKASGTQEGQLALECPACPHPGKNIPEDWRDAPADVRWLYTLFLMMDANFRARCKDRGLEETQLAPGWAYFVEESKYQAHLKARADDRPEENTCSVEHNAILKASIRREGYIASGVGAVLCARHALVRKNGTGDLQLGERQANMDYLAFRTLVGAALLLVISYDIVCQWTRHLWERMKNWPPAIQIDESRIADFRFGIPKEHIRVHGPGHSRYSFNLLPYVGRTYGEGIESQWSYMNPLALSTREMSLGMRHELMNDHWGSWNWRKILGFGPTLLRSLEEAHAFRIEQARIFREYSSTFDPNVVKTWEDMVAAWNVDQSRPDPYEEPKSKTSATAAIRNEIALEEAQDAIGGKLPPHEVTPGVFLQVGLELEEQQRAVRLRGSNGTSLSSLAEQQEKRNVLLRRIELWQGIQDVHMPMVAPLRVTGASTPPASSSAPLPRPSQPEEISLLLPSSLPPLYRSTDALAALLNKERRLRMAQMSDALEDIRHLRRILTGISEYMRFNVDGEGQRVTTRFRDLYSRFHAKVKRAAERYRAARAAVTVLDPSGSWTDTFKPLLDSDIRGPRREDDSRTTSDGRYEVSWIWLVPLGAPKSANMDHTAPASAEEFTASMRVEWAYAKARAERWKEEERLLLEEMRRVVEYCEWKATWWRSQGTRRDGDAPVAVQRGLHAYAAKQADVWGGLARRSASWWIAYLKTLGPLPDWILPY
ncbi:hypothetical protein C8Q70DRAFT_876809, partial [Cubamyces menziesii]